VRTLRFKPVWLLVSGFMILTVMLVSLMPIPQGGAIPNDKLMHLLTYLALGLWFGSLYTRDRFVFVGIVLAVFGLLIECLQHGTSYRSFELADLLADMAGTAIGLLLACTSLGSMLVLLEKKLSHSV
jgi:VanZ family protein